MLVWFVALAGLGLFALAQENTGNIFGRAIDENGGPLPGATVTLTGPHAPRNTVTDVNGNFRFLKVPPGRYKVTIALPSFSTFAREDVIVTLGRNTDVGAQLKLVSVQETITVTGSTPLIDTRKVETGVTFSSEEIQDIPTARDIYALMQQVPGIQLDTVNVAGNATARAAGGPDFSSKGSGNVTYQVDGASVTDNSYGAYNSGQARQNGGTNTYFDFDTFQEVDVSTGGSIIGQETPGVTINVVTKRGTNELKGSARYLYVSDRFQSQNLPQEAIDQGFETNSTRFIREYGAEMGGPIIKDRLWLWGSGSRQDISLKEIGFDPEGNAVTSTVRLTPWAAKLNAQISGANSLSLYYQRSNRTESGRGNGPNRAPETLTTLLIPTDFYKLDDSHVFSPDLFFSMFVNYQFPEYDDIPAGGTGPGSPQTVYYDGVYHGSYYFYDAKNPQYQGNGTVSKFFNTGSVNHELKFGFNYKRQINDSATGWPGDQIFGSEYSTVAYAAVVRNVRTVYKTEFFTGMLGDTLTAGNLTVNAGVRYEVERGRNLPGEAKGNPTFPELLPPVVFNGNDGYPFNYQTWQPRASIGYALGPQKTTQLRASYARYADQLGFVTWQMNGLPITSGFYYYWVDANADHHVDADEIDFDSGALFYYNVDPNTQPIPPNAVTPDFRPPITDEFTFGVDQQIANDFAVSATYTYRHAKDLQYRLPIGAGPDTWELGGFASGTAVAANGFTLSFDEPFYFLTLEDAPTGDLFLNRPAATQNYHGIELSAVKRLSNRWMLRGSFSWNSWKQSIPPEAILDPNNRWLLGGQNEDGGAVVGYSSKDTIWINARWQFNVAGLYQGPWGINFAANFFGREGYPQSYRIRSRQRDVDGARTSNLIGRIDDFRLANVYSLDLRLEKAFHIGPLTFTPMAECFNVTNAGTILQRESYLGDYNFNNETFIQDDNFNTILETQSPRIWRFGARISF
ncbi:MAG: TonB-dependent receptor [Thermoanaerobaculia bacterium]